MNLKVSLPKGHNESEFVFYLPFDLNKSARRTEGHFCVTENEIFVFIDGELSDKYAIDDFEEFACEQLVGCSMMVGRNEDGSGQKCLCAFTQDKFIKFAELCKILEHYKRTGIFVRETDNHEPRCPKCGMPLESGTECPFCVNKLAVMWKLIKRTAPYKWYFIGAVLCTVAAEIVGVIWPYVNKILVDNYVTPKTLGAGNGFFIICSVMVGLTAFGGLLDYLNMKCSFKVALSVGRDLRQDVFEKSQSLSMSSISKRTAGELIKRVSNDANKLQSFITDNGKDAVVKVFSLIIVAVITFMMNWKLALIAVVPVPFVALIVKRLFNIMAIRYGVVWRMGFRHSTLLHDILNGIKVVKSYGNEKREIERYTEASSNVAKASTRAETVWYLTWPLSDFIMTIGSFFVLYFGANSVLNAEMTLGTLMQFTSYVWMLYVPIRWLIQIPRILADASVSATKVFEILEEKSDVRDIENPVDLDIKGNIEFDDVYFGYKVYNPVLKGISCKINQGEMIGIVGPSGVGKSTMINLVLRLYDCTQGRILIDGVDIRNISQKSLRSQIGVVLQETFLFEGSVLDNITYAKPNATFEEIIEAAKIANAHEFITKLPDGYNTRVGNKGYSLSGGERQRIAIARAILHNPKIIILDEATASLDTQTEKHIQEALARLTKGRTTIAIAHRLSTLSNADRLLVLDRGKLAEFGTHDELMRNKGVYYKLVMAQRQTTRMKKVANAELAAT